MKLSQLQLKFWDWWFLRFFGSKRKFKLKNKHLDLFGNWRDRARVNFKCIIWVFGVPWVVSKFEKLKTQKSRLWSSIDRIFKCPPLRLTYNIAEAFLKLPPRLLISTVSSGNTSATTWHSFLANWKLAWERGLQKQEILLQPLMQG